MISIKGQLCYSPYPPDRYGDGVFGHGSMFGKDLQLWNLMYLSLPSVDLYLCDGFGAQAVYNGVPTAYTSSCVAMVRGKFMNKQFPHIRKWLRMPPLYFVNEIGRMQRSLFLALPTVMSIPDWYAVVGMRAKHIHVSDPSQQALNKFLSTLTHGT